VPGPADEPIRVLCAAVRTEHVKERIDLVSRALSREAERVGVGALPLANLCAVIPELSSPDATSVLELGAERSEVVILVGGQPVFARTLSIGISGLPKTAPELAARLRQTLAAARLALGTPVSRLFLTGGGAAAAGAEAYLASEVGVPVSQLPLPRLEGIRPDQSDLLPMFSRALGLALGLRGRSRDLDLRRGPLEYQRGYAFVKEKAPVLGALGGVILLSFFFSSWAELRSLAMEQEVLTAQLAEESKAVLGEETADAERAQELLETAKGKVENDPMPHIDGFDVMVELSKAVPTTVVHDVEELELAREHVKVRGIVGTTAEAEQIKGTLEKVSCFTDVKISKVTQLVNGTRQKYVLESDLKCPEDAQKKKGEAAEAAGEKEP